MVSCGAHRMNMNGPSPLDTNEQRLKITEIINHPSYSSFNARGDGSNDIAVIKTEGNFACTAGKIWPACLPDKSVSCLKVQRFSSPKLFAFYKKF